MNGKKTIVLAAVFSVLAMSTSAFAWDGQRKGFLLGLGAGLGLSSLVQTTEDDSTGRHNEGAFIVDFKIGYAPDNRLGLYFTEKNFSLIMDTTTEDQVVTNSSLFALGASYYRKPAAPSEFVAAGLGGMLTRAPLQEDSLDWAGCGLFLGAGYEFRNHLSIEADIMWGGPAGNLEGEQARLKVTTILLTLNALLY